MSVKLIVEIPDKHVSTMKAAVEFHAGKELTNAEAIEWAQTKLGQYAQSWVPAYLEAEAQKAVQPINILEE